MTRPGLILFAHGARDPLWARPFEAVAERVRAARPGTVVQLAFLEFMQPDLPAAGRALVDRGCSRVDIVPMFLGAGGHVRRDLPRLIGLLRETHPGVRFALHAAIGEVESVTEAMAAAAAATLDAP
jgi:sirohydrochlorin cobaltochelatase